MTIWGALAGGAIGTIVLTSGLRLAQELGWTRMDIPLLLGTVFTDSRSRAVLIGTTIHFANGFLFALGYYADLSRGRPGGLGLWRRARRCPRGTGGRLARDPSAPGGSPAHGHAVVRRRGDAAARSTRLPTPELRASNGALDAARPHCIRRDRRRFRGGVLGGLGGTSLVLGASRAPRGHRLGFVKPSLAVLDL